LQEEYYFPGGMIMAKKKKIVRKAPVKAPVSEQPQAIVEPSVEQPIFEQPVVAEPQKIDAPRKRLPVGGIAYVIGLLVAFFAALVMPQGFDNLTVFILALLGVIVGFMNVTEDEVLLFLVASVAFIVSASSIRVVLTELVFIETLMKAIIIFTASSAFIVSLRALFKVSKSE